VATAVEAAAPTAAAASLAGGVALPSDETYKGLPVGFTEEGLPYRGEPDAPIVMVEYSDFQCPFCSRYFVQTEPSVDESFVRNGQVRVVFHDLPLVDLHPEAPAAHTASLCVAEQGSATRYWEMHAELFRSVWEWAENADPLPVFARIAEQVGADMTAYQACMDTGEQAAIVEARVEVGMGRGVNGTPSFQFVRVDDGASFLLVGAQPYDQFESMVTAILAGETPSVAQEPETQAEPQGIPFWATAEGLASNPDRPGYTMAGDEVRGSEDAPLTIIEYSDFQCPFCKRHMDETQPTLDEKYVDTGQVRWVFKHFPLNIHPQAPAAGVAAECAAEQGQFWEMRTKLFEAPDSWSITEPNPIFVGYAEELGLDGTAFAACLDDPEMAARVDSDLQDGVQFVQGTPTFIVLHGTEGSIIPGALPVDTFVSILDEQLATISAE
jgi:protein-disulfide isomerase